LVWGLGALTVVSLFVLVAFHVFAAQSAFTLERLERDKRNEQLRYERLREQVATLSSAGVVREAARELGMVPGPGAVSLNVPAAAPTEINPDPVPTPLSAKNYDDVKQHLDP
jgi:hypothetical protein